MDTQSNYERNLWLNSYRYHCININDEIIGESTFEYAVIGNLERSLTLNGQMAAASKIHIDIQETDGNN